MVEDLKQKIISKLREIYDPEIPVNLYDLGLIYDIILDNNNVKILMTLTSPSCPSSDFIIGMVKDELNDIDEIKNVEVELTFEPLWSSKNISKEIRDELGIELEDNVEDMKSENISKNFEEKICFNCGISDDKLPILNVYYKGEKTTICSKCLSKF